MNTARRSWVSSVVPVVLAPEGRCTESPILPYVRNVRAALSPLYPDLGALWAEEEAAGARSVKAAEDHGDDSPAARRAHDAYIRAWDKAAKVARTVLRCAE
jgi:hypothetical protein